MTNNMHHIETVERSFALGLAGYRQITNASIQESLDIGDQVMARLRKRHVETGLAFPNQVTGFDPFLASTVGTFIANNPDLDMRSDSGSQHDDRSTSSGPSNQHDIIFDPTVDMTPGTNTAGIADWHCNVLGCGGHFTRNRTRQDHFEKIHGLSRDGTIKTSVSELFE